MLYEVLSVSWNALTLTHTHTRPTTQVNAYDLIPLCLSTVLKVCEGAPTFLPRGACLRFVPRCSDTLGASWPQKNAQSSG